MSSEEVLHKTIESLVKTNEQQARQLEEMSIRIKELTAQIAWFQRQMFVSINRSTPFRGCS